MFINFDTLFRFSVLLSIAVCRAEIGFLTAVRRDAMAYCVKLEIQTDMCFFEFLSTENVQ